MSQIQAHNQINNTVEQIFQEAHSFLEAFTTTEDLLDKSTLNFGNSFDNEGTIFSAPVQRENDLAIATLNEQTAEINQSISNSNRSNIGCSCVLCRSSQSITNGQSSYSLDKYTTSPASKSLAAAVTPQNAAAAPSEDYQIAALLGGNQWENSSTITYSFLTRSAANSYYGTEAVSELSGAIKNRVRTILETLIEPLINVNFVEVADSASSYGQVRYMFSSGPDYAYAYYPSSLSDATGGDVHLSPDYETDLDNKFSGNPGSYGYETLIHETLHALGLKHPGNYNGNGSGEGPFLSWGEDNNTNTVMTYNGVGSTAATLMPYDIKALQYLYGTKAYNPGNTTYSFNSVYGYTANGQSLGSSKTPMKLTIWDSKGIDTLDFSALTSNASGYRFDLREGGFNTTQSAYNSKAYTALDDTSETKYFTSTNGTAIAYNTVIENVKGSSSNDSITGNSFNNRLWGQAGNDSLSGEEGNDTLDGGAGNDILKGGMGNDTYIVDSGSDSISEISTGGVDKVVSSVSWTLGSNLENLTLSGTAAINGTGNSLSNSIRGNASNNTLKGGDGADTLNGGSGVDTLTGSNGNDILVGGAGNDKLTGGANNDKFLYDTGRAFRATDIGVDTIQDFNINFDKIVLDNDTFTSLFSAAGGPLLATEFEVVGSDSLAATSSADIVYSTATDHLFYNPNGATAGFGAGALFATLNGISSLSANNFLIQA